ncbi:hypothetical protein NP493_169g01039 [Ridgeia piscesae]|uniref:Uncharacterized protein n=1 Tax=Ridgeia piscesae TaxID=27915 RepID=A0AAD9UF96_RIDPI|nr:hypothetical protein NP493_169g01039 [Ridgeia piscesae]
MLMCVCYRRNKMTLRTVLPDARVEVIEYGGYRLVRLVAPLGDYYQPDDIVVRPHDQTLLVVDSRNDLVLLSRDLPESVDPFTVQAELLSGGTLVVVAPLKC